jgi:hypothetical protein
LQRSKPLAVTEKEELGRLVRPYVAVHPHHLELRHHELGLATAHEAIGAYIVISRHSHHRLAEVNGGRRYKDGGRAAVHGAPVVAAEAAAPAL